MKTRLVVLLFLTTVLAACQAQGPAGNRADFRYQWLSYLQGDDMRATCRADGPDRLRLIYNADFNKEIRTYDLFIADGGTGVLDTRRWISSGNLISLSGGSLSSLLDGQTGQVSLSAEQVFELTGLVAESGFPGPVPVGASLRSDGYFWAGLACVDGVFGIQVWQGDAMREIRFAGLLESWDPIAAPLPAASSASLPPLSSVIAANRRNKDASLLYYEAVVEQAAIKGRWRS
jgi:hypothetical protein